MDITNVSDKKWAQMMSKELIMFFVSSLLFFTGWKIASMKQELADEREVMQQQVDDFIDDSNAIIKIQGQIWTAHKEALLSGIESQKKQELTNFVEKILLCERLNPEDYLLEDHSKANPLRLKLFCSEQ